MFVTYFMIGLAVFAAVMTIKNENTFRKHQHLGNLIFRYGMECIHQGKDIQVSYHHMESYERTMFRLWDWSEKRILPKEKYDILMRFVMEGEV